MTDAIVKNLSFGEEARLKVFEGITKLTSAVSSTLGASGKCVMLEDNQGKPIITTPVSPTALNASAIILPSSLSLFVEIVAT